MPEVPSFDDAIVRMLALLRKQGRCCSGVRWVFREEFYRLDRHQVIARASVTTDDDRSARGLYAKGVASGFGCRVFAAFTVDDLVFFWIETCDDPVDAEYRMMPCESGLSVSLLEPLPKAKLVGPLSWAIRRRLSARYRQQLSIDIGVPFRGTVVA